MMTAQQLIAAFQGYQIADGYIPNTSGEVWTAEKQAKATAETVKKYGVRWIGHHVEDCSGAFVRAYRERGLSIYHGSNRIAREHVAELLPMEAAAPGMAVFKARKPGEKGYALPAEYRKGGKRCNDDLNDYYHIGLVDADGRHVLHCANTREGFLRSGIGQDWHAAAKLKQVEYAASGEGLEKLLRTAREAIDEALKRMEEKGWNT